MLGVLAMKNVRRLFPFRIRLGGLQHYRIVVDDSGNSMLLAFLNKHRRLVTVQ